MLLCVAILQCLALLQFRTEIIWPTHSTTTEKKMFLQDQYKFFFIWPA